MVISSSTLGYNLRSTSLHVPDGCHRGFMIYTPFFNFIWSMDKTRTRRLGCEALLSDSGQAISGFQHWVSIAHINRSYTFYISRPFRLAVRTVTMRDFNNLSQASSSTSSWPLSCTLTLCPKHTHWRASVTKTMFLTFAVPS